MSKNQYPMKVCLSLCNNRKASAILLYALCSYGDKFKYIYRDDRYICRTAQAWADQTGLSLRTVKYVMKDLEQRQLIFSFQKFHPKTRSKCLWVWLHDDLIRAVKSGENSANLAPCKLEQSAKIAPCKVQKLHHAHNIYINQDSEYISAAPKHRDSGVIKLDDFREDKKLKEKTGKAQKILSTKTGLSFDQVSDEAVRKKMEIEKPDTVSPKNLEIYWKRLSTRYFEGTKHFAWEGKDFGYAKSLISKAHSAGVDIFTVLDHCFIHWGEFSEYMIRNRGFRNAPDFPTIGFFAGNAEYVLNFSPDDEDGNSVQLTAPKKKKKQSDLGMRKASDIYK